MKLVRLTYDAGEPGVDPVVNEFPLYGHVHYDVYPFGKDIPAVVFEQGVLAVGPRAEELFGDDVSHFCEWGMTHAVYEPEPGTCGCEDDDLRVHCNAISEYSDYVPNGDQPEILVHSDHVYGGGTTISQAVFHYRRQEG